MSNIKKQLFSSHYFFTANFFLILSLLGTVFVLLNHNSYGILACAIVVSFSTLNIYQRQRRKCSDPDHFKRMTPSSNSTISAKVESFLKFFGFFLLSSCVYAVIAVSFGAPVLTSHYATLYFSVFLSVLTVLPFCLSTEISIISFTRIFVEVKHETVNDVHVYYTAVGSIIGAWMGAFPIPLDWDRPWQEWPVSCCVGSVLGYGAGHIVFIGHVLSNCYWTKKTIEQCA